LLALTKSTAASTNTSTTQASSIQATCQITRLLKIIPL
jgi:hypothetical protein